MSITAQELSQFQGKKVVIVQNLNEPNDKGESAVEKEGTAEVANEIGVLLKPKGKVNLELVDFASIEEIRYAPERLTPLKQKVLQPVTFGAARKHLADRHGIALDWINENSEEDALRYHQGVDHSNLGHKHEDKADGAAASAVSDAEDEDL